MGQREQKLYIDNQLEGSEVIASNKRRRRIVLSELSPRITIVSSRQQQPPDIGTTHYEAIKDIHDNFDAESSNTINSN